MEQILWIVSLVFSICLALFHVMYSHQIRDDIVAAQEFPIASPSEVISPTTQANQSFGSTSSTSTSIPTPTRTNPFIYTPLPTDRGGPENDIIEVSPLRASRDSAQVDDSITFSVTIKNQAPYRKHLWNMCFESTDGNFGCIFSIDLQSGQSITLNNVGTWVHPGTKEVWVTWSQDNINFYTPLNANTLHVHILG